MPKDEPHIAATAPSKAADRLSRLWENAPDNAETPDLASALGDLDSLTPQELAEALRVDALERHRRGLPFNLLMYESRLGAELENAPAAVALLMLQIATDSPVGGFTARADELRAELPDRFSDDIDHALRLLTGDDHSADDAGADLAPRSHAEARIGEVIGGCKVTEIIDAGAQGVVYRAFEKPEYGGELERPVAVKVLNTRVAKKAELARFEAESEYLSRLSHPGVARVFRTGRTPDDRPFFVMEYIAGAPITEYADRRRLTIRQRLDLFRQVCEAVGHVHQRQLIHRDLKPSNILVTEISVGERERRPQVKIIDFGLAKSVGARLSQASMVTNLGDVIGTLSYMAPEQAGHDQLDIDQRADVFALGAVLYELLTGRAPLDQRGAQASSARRNIDIYALVRTADRPSAVRGVEQLGEQANDAAACRGLGSADRLIHTLEHELQWIPAYAMRLEPDRRYQTALQLAEDIDNYLQGRPLIAGPDSRWYRLRKTARQHRGPIAAAAVIVLVVGVSGIVAGVGFWQANQRAGELEDAVVFMENIILENDPDSGFTGLRGGGRNIRLVDVLTHAPTLIRRQFADTPRIEQRLVAAVGRSLLYLGEGDAAAAELARALEMSDEAYLTTTEGWDIALDLAEALRVCKEYDESMAILDRMNEIEAPTREHRVRLTELLAIVMKFQGKFDEAETQYQDAYRQWVRLKGADSKEALQSQFSRSLLDLERGRVAPTEGNGGTQTDYYKLAVARLEDTLARQRQLLGDTDLDTLSTSSELASMYARINDTDRAATYYKQSISGLSESIGADHWRTLEAVINYASLCLKIEHYQEAQRGYNRALDAYAKQGRIDEKDYWIAAFGYALSCRALENPALGARRLDSAYESMREFGVAAINHERTLNLLCDLYAESGDRVRLEYWESERAKTTEP